MDAFSLLPAEIDHLVQEFSSIPVIGNLTLGLTQYSVWLIIATIVLVALATLFVKKMTLVPKGMFVNSVEWVVEYVENDIAKGILGATWKKHFPLLASLFFFILINNVIGLIPGMKTGTGAIGTTFALALFSFIYFVWVGIKKHGFLGYFKSLAPAGLNPFMTVLVWAIELISLCLRLVTLAVRLFCNMFAGHVVMGSFAILTTLFISPLLAEMSASALVSAAISPAWLVILTVIYGVEIIVAIVQAYVFTLLTAVYIQIAESDEH